MRAFHVLFSTLERLNMSFFFLLGANTIHGRFMDDNQFERNISQSQWRQMSSVNRFGYCHKCWQSIVVSSYIFFTRNNYNTVNWNIFHVETKAAIKFILVRIINIHFSQAFDKYSHANARSRICPSTPFPFFFKRTALIVSKLHLRWKISFIFFL